MRLLEESLTPRLTGAGARSAEGTDMGHENAEGMAHVGVRVEPPVRRRGLNAGNSLHVRLSIQQREKGQIVDT